MASRRPLCVRCDEGGYWAAVQTSRSTDRTSRLTAHPAGAAGGRRGGDRGFTRSQWRGEIVRQRPLYTSCREVGFCGKLRVANPTTGVSKSTTQGFFGVRAGSQGVETREVRASFGKRRPSEAGFEQPAVRWRRSAT